MPCQVAVPNATSIRTANPQVLSHKRPRVKGRFVKNVGSSGAGKDVGGDGVGGGGGGTNAGPCLADIIGMSPATTHEPRTSEDPEAGDEADDEQVLVGHGADPRVLLPLRWLSTVGSLAVGSVTGASGAIVHRPGMLRDWVAARMFPHALMFE